ncbi:MAG TPA: hypothetical protein ENI55_04755, partial [Alphaproteobacteria bacterium]|nr:hypothetical protein [Alphaproteobacteria bacterium]
WRADYNTTRPHSSLDGLTPIEFATRSKLSNNVGPPHFASFNSSD